MGSIYFKSYKKGYDNIIYGTLVGCISVYSISTRATTR